MRAPVSGRANMSSDSSVMGVPGKEEGVQGGKRGVYTRVGIGGREEGGVLCPGSLLPWEEEE